MSYESRAGFRGGNRKRKRVYHSGPETEAEPELELVNSAPKPSTAIVLEDTKVVNYLNKLRGARSVLNDTTTFVKIVVSISEADYFSAEILNTIKGHFDIKDITISPSAPGAIERFISLFGNAEQVARGALYISYILSAVLNNVSKEEFYTLKSSNYRSTLLVTRNNSPHSISAGNEIIHSSLSYSEHTSLDYLVIVADLNSSFHTINAIAEKSAKIPYLEDTKITQYRLFGNVTDPNLFQRSDQNAQLLTKNRNKVVSFIYDHALKS